MLSASLNKTFSSSFLSFLYLDHGFFMCFNYSFADIGNESCLSGFVKLCSILLRSSVSLIGHGARCSSVVRAFAHGVMGRWINPSV